MVFWTYSPSYKVLCMDHPLTLIFFFFNFIQLILKQRADPQIFEIGSGLYGFCSVKNKWLGRCYGLRKIKASTSAKTRRKRVALYTILIALRKSKLSTVAPLLGYSDLEAIQILFSLHDSNVERECPSRMLTRLNFLTTFWQSRRCKFRLIPLLIILHSLIPSSYTLSQSVITCAMNPTQVFYMYKNEYLLWIIIKNAWHDTAHLWSCITSFCCFRYSRSFPCLPSSYFVQKEFGYKNMFSINSIQLNLLVMFKTVLRARWLFIGIPLAQPNHSNCGSQHNS